jgi:hypothetical protein
MTTTDAPSVQQLAQDAIDLYREYLSVHGYDEARARAQAIAETVEGATAALPGGADDE